MTDNPEPGPDPVAKKGKEDKAGKSKKKAAKRSTKSFRNLFFASEAIPVDIVDEVVEKARFRRILRVVQMQIMAIAFMTLFFLGAAPILRTVYLYYAVDTSRHAMRLAELPMPNMTNQAILSWATKSITEIMTFGFGDYLPHLRAQQGRFTPEGWTSFVAAFDKMKLGQAFKDRQLVLTTVPSDTAVILSQGFNPKHVYEWKVEMPVVMTYATNDNITHKDSAIVDLTISRIPTSDNPEGIAIKIWTVAG